MSKIWSPSGKLSLNCFGQQETKHKNWRSQEARYERTGSCPVLGVPRA